MDVHLKQFRFYKAGPSWYMDLKEYLEEGGKTDDLEMIEGADRMLDIYANGQPDIWLYISDTSFPGADELKLREKCSSL